MNGREDRIRERAFAIWIEEGQPDGKDREHWERAEKEVSDGSDNHGVGLVDRGEGQPPMEGRIY